MKDIVKAPIIVDENGDVNIFESIEDAERYLEPTDVENNEYTAYDSQGRLLRLIATHPRITIESAELEPSHISQLHTILQRFLAYMGLSEAYLRNASSTELIKRLLEYKTR